MNNTYISMSRGHERHSEPKILKMNRESVGSDVTQGQYNPVTQPDTFLSLETLVTRLSKRNDTSFTEGGDVCDVGDIRINDVEEVGDDFRRILTWFEVALSEGHIEPSQPIIGRITGWPVRTLNLESLWVDYCLWNRKKGEDSDKFGGRKLFRHFVSLIFDLQDEDFVNFSTLEKSRNRFESLRSLIEHFELG